MKNKKHIISVLLVFYNLLQVSLTWKLLQRAIWSIPLKCERKKKTLSQYCLAPAWHRFQGHERRTTQTIQTFCVQLVPDYLLTPGHYSTSVVRYLTAYMYLYMKQIYKVNYMESPKK